MDAEAWNERYAAEALVWSAEPNRFVISELGGLAPGRALDLAAGEGRNAIWLAGRGWRVTAVDFSDVAIGKGRKLARRRGVTVDWLTTDLRSYRPEPAGFDLVLAAYLHLPPTDLGVVLEAATGALAPGGVLLVIGHDATNLGGGVGGPQDPELLYTPESIAAALVGLRIDRAVRAARPVATRTGLREAIDTVVRAHRPVGALDGR
ncbi:MAG TPA: methyltransferase domain-containing protein [Micromonosporaceae bacterium]|nr:methyltransferase domain-containing protein [Micromonosporaceae bacterium]